MDCDYSKLADSDSPFAQRAAALLERGFSITPVLPRAKQTIVGAKARTRDVGIVTLWAEDGYFDGNVGLCADASYTLLESDDVTEFTQKIREMTGREIPRTLKCGSGRENRCCWIFKRTPACGDLNPASGGIFEFRNFNQYVVGPGSIHPDGYVYRWLDDVPVLEMPDWLVEAIIKIDAEGKQQRERILATPGERVPAGQRHNFLVNYGGKLVKDGISLQALECEFHHLNTEKFEAPLPEREVIETASDLHQRYGEEPHIIVTDAPAEERSEKGLVGVEQILSDVQPQNVRWLWAPYIPMAMITVLTGDPGAGKSYIALAIAGRESLLGRSTIYLTVENSAEYTLRPRFDALGGDPRRLILLRGVDTGDGGIRSVQLEDVQVIAQSIRRHDARMVVVDPLQSYLGAHIDAHRSNQTRPVLDVLAQLAEQTGIAILILRHGAKNGSGRAIYKGQGSIDFTGAARSELMAGEAPDGRKALVHIKSNIGAFGVAQGYEITTHNPAGDLVNAGHFRWLGDSEVSSADLMEVEKRDTVKDEAKDLLKEILASGPRLASECFEEAKQVGISTVTLKRTKADLKVRSFRLIVPGPWSWRLPILKGEPVDTLANAQHTNSLINNNLFQGYQGYQESPLETLADTLASEPKTTPTNGVGGFNLRSPEPKEPRRSNRWEDDDEDEQ